MDGEAPRHPVLFEHNGLASPIRPLDQQRHVEFAEAFTQLLLQLILAQREDADMTPRSAAAAKANKVSAARG
ncbi:hypothetical protein G3480_24265 [Thiorhodococcus mannitoliphagus]|uniref:Uncharacterized protein n=1 Tax=Thiorhodococcus mannitoliphagus TaxID=329406 RepID=A0A6P1E0E6_9GAMM|nr:hypothetical protein [Thiorhodococcus mannitoliphagus]